MSKESDEAAVREYDRRLRAERAKILREEAERNRRDADKEEGKK